jgi:hypothetical protein
MKKDQIMVSQATKNPLSLSNLYCIDNNKYGETKEDN